MKLNELHGRPGSRTSRRRMGRGVSAGQGKTCGRGHKGQRSRSGGKVALGFEGGQLPLQRRIPTFGFRSGIGRVTGEVRLHELKKVEENIVDLATLKKAGILSSNIKRAKIVLSGTLDRPLTVRGVKVTKGAREAIVASGGQVED